MKQLSTKVLAAIIAIVFSVSLVQAQAPQAIPYQAVARNAAGNIMPNKNINLQFKLYDGSATGTLVYYETQAATTNALGLFTVNVGQGNTGPFAPSFSNINWQDNSKWLEVAIDTNGGNNFVVLGTQQLLSVPFALNARNGVPVGSIQAFAGDTTKIPDGWMLCDGRELSTTDPKYANLFSVIGAAWGSSTATKFNVPDLRGRFLRGVDGSAGRDPDKNARTAMNIGSNTGNKVGSVQQDAFQGHRHYTADNFYGPYGWSNLGLTGMGGVGPASNAAFSKTSSPTDDGTNGAPRAGAETRPINAYVNYIIKY